MLKLSGNSKAFLDTISNRIINNNTLLIPNLEKIKISILKDQRPLHFSFPGGEILLSTGLLVKYIKDEGTLAAIVSFETIKAAKDLYRDRLSYPLGIMPLQKVLEFNQSTLEERLEINKWVYLVLNRSRYNPSSLLSYIQNQNKNLSEFIFLLGSRANPSREEFLFKRFLLQQGVTAKESVEQSYSSSEFYEFINEVRRSST